MTQEMKGSQMIPEHAQLTEAALVPRVQLQKINLHPLAGMKAVPLQGDERKFQLSEKAKARQDAAKRSKKNWVAPKVKLRQQKLFVKNVGRMVDLFIAFDKEKAKQSEKMIIG